MRPLAATIPAVDATAVAVSRTATLWPGVGRPRSAGPGVGAGRAGRWPPSPTARLIPGGRRARCWVGPVSGCGEW